MPEILDAIKSCITRRKIFWTYHVNMRLSERHISRETIIASVDSYEIIETYPHDKYMPSYLMVGEHGGIIFHLLAALDTQNDTVRIITAYKPSHEKWAQDGRTRREL